MEMRKSPKEEAVGIGGGPHREMRCPLGREQSRHGERDYVPARDHLGRETNLRDPEVGGDEMRETEAEENAAWLRDPEVGEEEMGEAEAEENATSLRDPRVGEDEMREAEAKENATDPRNRDMEVGEGAARIRDQEAGAGEGVTKLKPTRPAA